MTEQAPRCVTPAPAPDSQDGVAHLPRDRCPATPRRLTFEQRDRLEELYDIVNNTHPVDRAGARCGRHTSCVRHARPWPGSPTAGGPRGPRDQAALIEAQKVLGDHALGRMNTGAHQRYRAALRRDQRHRARRQGGRRDDLRPARVRRGAPDQRHGHPARRDPRTPMTMPGKGSKNWKAIAGSPRPPGGDRSVLGRAKENHELAAGLDRQLLPGSHRHRSDRRDPRRVHRPHA